MNLERSQESDVRGQGASAHEPPVSSSHVSTPGSPGSAALPAVSHTESYVQITRTYSVSQYIRTEISEHN